MTAWLALWTGLLLVTLAAYSVLVVVVTIGGFSDMVAMFRQLDKGAQKEEAAKPDDMSDLT